MVRILNIGVLASTKATDLQKNNPFPLWNNPKNQIHKLLWQLANEAIDANKKYNKNNKDIWARKHLNQGLASCSWWWAAAKKPDVFSPITWITNHKMRFINTICLR